MDTKKLLYIYSAILILGIIITGIFTENKIVWILDTIFIFLGIILLLTTYKNFAFSKLSYTAIFVYLILPLIGSYYGATKVPVGFFLQDLLNLRRNPYDRIVHFCFGLFLYYPLFEIFKKTSKIKKKFWIYFVPLIIIIAAGGLYEVAEWIDDQNLPLEDSQVFIGMQGDFWDAQKDILMETLGGILAMTILLGKNKQK